MRALLVLFAALFVASPAYAAGGVDDIVDIIGGIIGGGRPGNGPGHGGNHGPGHGGVRCSAVDRGWEEHFGGHATCEDCVRRHGSCIETCEFSEHTCVAEGRRWGGRPIQAEGYGYSRWEAERQAVETCERRGARRCYVINCYENPRTERRECSRDDGGWGDRPGRRP